MWKRDEAVRPSGQPTAAPQPPTPMSAGVPSPRPESGYNMEKDIVNIGKSVVIKGELNGSEDLTIEGHVEGTIQLRDHVLTIGPNGRIKAQVFAKSVIVLGEVTGNVTATEKFELRASRRSLCLRDAAEDLRTDQAGEQADHDDDDEKLDEREASLVLTHAIEHVVLILHWFGLGLPAPVEELRHLGGVHVVLIQGDISLQLLQPLASLRRSVPSNRAWRVCIRARPTWPDR